MSVLSAQGEREEYKQGTNDQHRPADKPACVFPRQAGN